ncbi:2',3'-cyclic-nucleotide 2'-phosphodiesterase/3'-nucleotidase [Paucibacter oligotrophus]|uniref:2',3'-cyclic-nucleotide 2'-phosphodiesterase/3'-nucleotidase n=1 Tax=Roseateles oligotrophus TaxID=1769250 RepID=A0A840LD64_9BURK|nr:bifunctional 2',3'-cyclic-nucleotide 2'-phosphodiesterase/3'-nucleotidase [Roseateles oligotrophus]MBB4844009.1 2',3'-cyclic-nucleotide 2'-phosphodiesterase/3'-nucleotidase [Roseateles oligotrophus]
MPNAIFPRALLLALGLSGCLLAGAQAQDSRLKLRLMQTSDLHMNLLNYDYYQDRPTEEYGLARTLTLIQQARGQVANSLLFDNGDLLQGNPLGDLVARIKPLAPGQTHPAYKVLNLLQVDAANIGNHEFNYGLPFLRQALSGAGFPYVNANVMRAEAAGKARHAFTPYVLLERQFKDEAGKTQRLKIGVIGFVPPQIMQWDRPLLAGRVRAEDMVETARRLVPRMRREGADLVIAIAHSGFEKTPQGRLAENTVAELAQVPGIDALLFGHAHAEFPGPQFADYPGVDAQRGRIHGVPAVMPGRWGDHLGIIDLELQRAGKSRRWTLSHSQAQLRPIFDRQTRRALVEADPLVAHVIAQEHADTLAHVRAQLGLTPTPIHSYFAQVLDEASVRIVARAQLAYLERAVQGTAFEGLPLLAAAAPFKAGGRQGWSHYTDIPAGPLAIKHVADLYVYPNTLKVLKLRGSQIREWLEMSAGQFRHIDAQGPAAQDLLAPEFRAYNFDSLRGRESYRLNGQELKAPELSYEIDVSVPARYDAEGRRSESTAWRIRNLRFRGQPLDAQAEFLVATNNYRASGGGNFPGLGASQIVIDSPDENRQALASYLAQMSGKAEPPPQAAWRILPVPGVSLRFESGAGAQKYLPDWPQLRLLEARGDGSLLLELLP